MKGQSLLSFQGWDSHLCTHGGSVANCLQLTCVWVYVCVCSSSEEENVMGLLICLQLDVRPSKPRAGCSVPATFLTNVEICWLNTPNVKMIQFYN